MKVQAYVNFDGRCEEALEFYKKSIGAEVTSLMRWKESPDAVRWYAIALARPADSTPMPGLAEWKFPGGGCLQVYALPERAGSCSCTLTVSDIDLEASRLEKLGVATGSKMGDQVKVFMVKDPDGNSIAFAQDPK